MTSDNTISISSTHPRVYHLVLLLIIALTISMRLSVINRTVRLDEGRSLQEYAMRPISDFLFDFSDTNNHFLNTVMQHIQYRLLGDDADWKLRVHVFVIGIFVTIATYYTGKELYDVNVGIMASALTSVMYLLIEFSVNARGYIHITLIYLLMIIAINRVRTQTNRRGWTLIGLLSALGFFVSPIFLYSMGTLGVWVLLSVLFENTGEQRRRVLFYFMGAMILGGVLTLLFYGLAVAQTYGSTTQLAQSNLIQYTEPRSSESFFNYTLPNTLKTLFHVAHMGMMPPIFLMCLVGTFFAIIDHRKISKNRIPLPLAIVVWLTLQFIVQRTFILERTFTFLMPVYAIWIAAGWFALIQRVIKRPIPRLPIVIFLSVIMVVPTAYQLIRQDILKTSILTGSMPYGREVVDKLPSLVEQYHPIFLQARFIIVLDYYYRRDGINVDMYPIKSGYESFLDNMVVGESVYLVDEYHVRLSTFIAIHNIMLPDQNFVLEPIMAVTDHYFLYKITRIPPTLKEITDIQQVDTFWFMNPQKVSVELDDSQILTFNMFADDWKLFRYRYGKHWQDYHLSMLVNITDTSDEYEELRIHVREADDSSYILELNVADNGMLSFRLDIASEDHDYLNSTAFEFELNHWYAIAVEVAGDTLTAYIDGEQILQAQDTTLTHGSIAILASPDAKVQITDIRLD